MTTTSPGVSISRRTGRRVLLTSAVIALVGTFVGLPSTPANAAGATFYVSTAGSDSGNGSASSPYRTLQKAFSSLHPGDLLYVRGGTYVERLKLSVPKGTASAPVTVKAYPGERPVVQGLLWLTSADYWTLDGLNVTWSTGNSSGEHMVKMTGGVGWRLTNAEIWGARSYAALLIAGTPSAWRVDHMNFHDTYRSNSTNQDHLIYVNGGTGGGIIERNLFNRSENGRGVKIGPPSGSTSPIGNVTIRYNNFYGNLGPSNIQLSFGASNNKIYRNIMVRPNSTSTPNVTAYNLNGSGNQGWDNVGWEAGSVLESSPNLKDLGGNIKTDPRYDGSDALRPLNAAMANYGRYAPGDDGSTPAPTASPTPTATASPTPTPTATATPTAMPSTLSFTSSADTYVKNSQPTGNWGGDSELRLRDLNDPVIRSFVRFNVTGVSGTPKAVKLRLRVTDGSAVGGTVHRVSSNSWGELTTTWATAPAFDSVALAKAQAVAAATYVDIVLPASAVPGNGTYSFALLTSSSDSAIYASRETATPPVLVLS